MTVLASRRKQRLWLFAVVIACALLTAGCASKSIQPEAASTPSIVLIKPSNKAAAILRTARSLIGTHYKWGGASPKVGFDCSGLVWYVYTRHNVALPRISWQQFGAGSPVAYTDLRPGDLIFHKVEKKANSLHVGIVTDRGSFIHSPSSGSHVMESRLSNPFWKAHFIGARRVL